MIEELKPLMAELKKLLVSQKTVFNVDDFCTYTGLAKPTLYKLTSAHLIPFSCPQGKVIYFEKTKVDEWLLKNPILPIDDVDQRVINRTIDQPAKGGKSWQ